MAVSQPAPPRQWSHGRTLAAILALTALVYGNVFRNGFIDFDDPENVLDNYAIRELSAENVRHWFTAPLQYMYTPLVSWSYAVDYRIGRLDPTAYHVTNLLLHLGNTGLVYLLLRALTRKRFVIVFVTVGFAIHPMNVDTVSWISTRSTLLATAFSLGCLLAYLRYRRDGRWGYLAAAVGLFGLAVLSKSTAVTLPLALLLLDHYQRRPPSWRLLAEKVPFFVIAAVTGIGTLHYRVDASNLHHYAPANRVVLVCAALAGYLLRLVVPYPLAFAYAYPDQRGAFLPWHLYLAPVLLAVVAVALYRSKVPNRVVTLGLLFFGCTVVLSQTVLLVDNYQSNRYVYLPYLGLLLIAAHLVRRLLLAARGWRARLRPLWRGVLVAYLVAFAVLTVARSSLWNSQVAVWDDSIRHQPGVPFVYNSRGMASYHRGDYPAALRDFRRATDLDPNFTLSYYYQGVIKGLSGDFAGALADLDRAVALSSGFAPAYGERGKARLNLGDVDGALADLSQSVTWDSYYVDAWLYRGLAHHRAGRYQEAVADFDRALRLDPGLAAAYAGRGTTRAQLGDQAGACADWRRSQALGSQQAAASITANCPG
jgi:tetratricopeptide (TPR) repeat protein